VEAKEDEPRGAGLRIDGGVQGREVGDARPPTGAATEVGAAGLRAWSREAVLDPLLGRGRPWFEETRYVGRKPATTARDPRSRERKKRPIGFGTAP
jgi:hypothetical protein